MFAVLLFFLLLFLGVVFLFFGGAVLFFLSFFKIPLLIKIIFILVSVSLIVCGFQNFDIYERKNTSKIMIFLGVLFIPLGFGFWFFKILLGALLVGVLIYFLSNRCQIFLTKKGVFKDSRNNIYIKEWFSNICINHLSNNISSVKVITGFSNINLNFENSDISDTLVNFHVNVFFSKVKVVVNPYWNIIVNGQYIRKNSLSNKIVNINYNNLFGFMDII